MDYRTIGTPGTMGATQLVAGKRVPNRYATGMKFKVGFIYNL
jgi:hypothetical protein